jgi:hypothetical protein
MRILASFLLILLASFHAQASDVTWDATCQYNAFPVFAGGSSNEYLNCMLYDSTQDYIITAGKTSSNDFAPA